MSFRTGLVFAVLVATATLAFAGGQNEKSETAKPISFTLSVQVANVKDQEPATYFSVEKFNEEHPSIHVDLEGSDTNSHIQKMKMAAQSGTLPAVFWMLPAAAKVMEENNYLLDLKPSVDGDAQWASSFRPGMLDLYAMDGKLYGLPYFTFVTGFWYNKALLDQYGLQPPKTYSDLLDVAKVLHSHGVATIAQGAKDNFSVWALMTMLARFGFFEKADAILAGNAKWDNPDFLRFYEDLAQLRDAGAFPVNVSEINYFQSRELFVGEKAAMLDSGNWDAQQFDKVSFADKVGFWPGPTFSDGAGSQKVAMKMGGAPWVVSKETGKDKSKLNAVITFLKFYFGPEGSRILIQNDQIPVVRTSGSIDTTGRPAFAALLKSVNDESWAPLKTQPDIYLGEALGNALYDSIYGVITGVYTPEQACQMMDQKISQLHK